MEEAKKHKKTIGTLAPIFSLSSKYQRPQDQGTFETGEYFLDWIKKTGQNAWQILPFNETQLEKGSATKHVPSPYKGYGIGLAPKYLSSTYAKKRPTLQEKNTFILEHKDWLEDYALFCTIRDVYGTDDWRVWDRTLCTRQKGALTKWAKEHAMQINYYIVQQWQLHESYKALHLKAKKLGISLIGDIPYYVSIQSPLVWAHQKAFQLDAAGVMPYVSGIPNKSNSNVYFGRQLWGHPLYQWSNKEEVVKLWKLRLQYQALLFDDIRLDHAKAFFDYGVLDSQDPSNDHFADGPGSSVMEELIKFSQHRSMHIFVEDSGDRKGFLHNSLNKLHIAGIKIFYFSLGVVEGELNENYALIKNYPENCVAYTTTHDTMTLLGYMQELDDRKKKILAQAAGVPYGSDEAMATHLRTAIINSSAATVIIPIQDWLLTTDRINTPGTEKEIGDTNWHYRVGMPIEELPLIKKL